MALIGCRSAGDQCGEGGLGGSGAQSTAEKARQMRSAAVQEVEVVWEGVASEVRPPMEPPPPCSPLGAAT